MQDIDLHRYRFGKSQVTDFEYLHVNHMHMVYPKLCVNTCVSGKKKEYTDI